MKVGEVRVAEDADFERLKQLCQCHEGWKKENEKQNITVWTKSTTASNFKTIKVRGDFEEMPANVVYDVLHDPQYRHEWDTNMIDGFELCQLNATNDIGYYSLKVPIPLKNRDFVIQRSWLAAGNEFTILNHSINHLALPPKKHFIRGVSYLTGYHVVSTAGNKDLPGSQITYVTLCDPRGKIPAWLMNEAAEIFAPKAMKMLYQACRKYEAWKIKNRPNFKPWLYPEQNDLPSLKMSQIGTYELAGCNSVYSPA